MGSFPAPVTGWEFILDKDGSVCKQGSTIQSSPTVLTLQDYSIANNIQGGASPFNFNILFPQVRSITAYSVSIGGTNVSIATSVNTTDGVDGTWTNVVLSSTAWNWAGLAALRTPIPVAWSNVIGVRFTVDGWMGMASVLSDVHLWGLHTLPGLQLTHPTIDQPLTAADMDFGDVQRNQLILKQFRVKNVNAQTANSITVALENVGSNNMYTNTDLDYNSSIAKSHNIGNLAPNAISSLITVRRSVASNEAQSVQGSVRLGTSAGSWT